MILRFTLPRGRLDDLPFELHAAHQLVGEREADREQRVVGEVLVADQPQAAG
jgi:hypothetical protein